MARTPQARSMEIDAYLERIAEPARSTLAALRAVIHRAVPGAEEVISYSIPAIRRGGVVAGFAATRSHCALYLFSGSVTAAFARRLTGYDVSKGTVRFSAARPLPEALVRSLVQARLAEIAQGAAAKGAPSAKGATRAKGAKGAPSAKGAKAAPSAKGAKGAPSAKGATRAKGAPSAKGATRAKAAPSATRAKGRRMRRARRRR